MYYNPTRKCTRHMDETAATCSECYDAALRQQAVQRKEEQKLAHTEYLLNARRGV